MCCYRTGAAKSGTREHSHARSPSGTRNSPSFRAFRELIFLQEHSSAGLTLVSPSHGGGVT